MHYYDYHKILSYNCPVNILIGERGVGKSYGAKNYVINKFIKKNEHFLYLRRYDNELKSLFNRDFFGDIKPKFSNLTLTTKNRKFYCNQEEFGIAKRMTEAQDLKSADFSNISTIIIDEYPIEKNKRYYLPNEGMILMSIFDSVIRNRNDVKIFILGNSVERFRIFTSLFVF